MSSIHSIFRAMNYYIKPITLLALTLFTCFSSLNAQELKYELSEPVNISIAGTDKLLLMKNGNTVLFHFENRKGIIVKIFDSKRKEIATRKHICDVLDINTLDQAKWKGLLEINNEAVLFLTQHIDNRATLIRVRINSTTGDLIKEDKVIQSKSFQIETSAVVLRANSQSGYYIACSESSAGYIEKNIVVNAYDSGHNIIKTFPLNIKNEGYDYLEVTSSNIDGNGGIIIIAELAKIVQYPTLMDRTLVISYLPHNGDQFISGEVKMPPSFRDFYTKITYNSFSQTVNILLCIAYFGQTQDAYMHNMHSGEYSYIEMQSLITMHEDMSGMNYKPIENKKLREKVYNLLDTTYEFYGSVNKMTTNNRSISTIFYDGEVNKRNEIGNIKNIGKKNVGVLQYDEEGNEIWGDILSKSKLKNYNKYPQVFRGIGEDEVWVVGDMGKGSEDNICMYDCAISKNNQYVLFNEIGRNFGKSIADIPDSVYNCELSDGAFYKISKRKVEKKFVFGEPTNNQHKQIVTRSGMYDADKNIYTTLIRDRKGKEITSKIAWIQLEP
jgi:hypothetical protein